jgi:hypothetical protein
MSEAQVGLAEALDHWQMMLIFFAIHTHTKEKWLLVFNIIDVEWATRGFSLAPQTFWMTQSGFIRCVSFFVAIVVPSCVTGFASTEFHIFWLVIVEESHQVSLDRDSQSLLLAEHEPHKPWGHAGRPSLLIEGGCRWRLQGIQDEEQTPGRLRMMTLRSNRWDTGSRYDQAEDNVQDDLTQREPLPDGQSLAHPRELS